AMGALARKLVVRGGALRRDGTPWRTETAVATTEAPPPRTGGGVVEAARTGCVRGGPRRGAATWRGQARPRAAGAVPRRRKPPERRPARQGGVAYADDGGGRRPGAATRSVACPPQASATWNGPSDLRAVRAGRGTYFLPNAPPRPGEGAFGRKNVRKTSDRLD